MEKIAALSGRLAASAGTVRSAVRAHVVAYAAGTCLPGVVVPAVSADLASAFDEVWEEVEEAGLACLTVSDVPSAIRAVRMSDLDGSAPRGVLIVHDVMALVGDEKSWNAVARARDHGIMTVVVARSPDSASAISETMDLSLA